MPKMDLTAPISAFLSVQPDWFDIDQMPFDILQRLPNPARQAMWLLATVFHPWYVGSIKQYAFIFGPGAEGLLLKFAGTADAYEYFNSNGWEPISSYVDRDITNFSMAFRKVSDGKPLAIDRPPVKLPKKLAKKLRALGILPNKIKVKKVEKSLTASHA